MGVKTVVFDDLTGLEADVKTHEFAIDGTTYEIDLADETFAKLCSDLADYTTNARKVASSKRGPGRPATVGGTKTRADKEQNKAMREWARANGYGIADRGRIPDPVQKAYHANDVLALHALIAPADAPVPVG
jgi:hypothetical protein